MNKAQKDQQQAESQDEIKRLIASCGVDAEKHQPTILACFIVFREMIREPLFQSDTITKEGVLNAVHERVNDYLISYDNWGLTQVLELIALLNGENIGTDAELI